MCRCEYVYFNYTLCMNKSEIFYKACFIQRHLTEGYFGVAHFTVTFLTLITSSTNCSVTQKFQTNYVICPRQKQHCRIPNASARLIGSILIQ